MPPTCVRDSQSRWQFDPLTGDPRNGVYGLPGSISPPAPSNQILTFLLLTSSYSDYGLELAPNGELHGLVRKVRQTPILALLSALWQIIPAFQLHPIISTLICTWALAGSQRGA